jgi:PAS domain-containing protein
LIFLLIDLLYLSIAGSLVLEALDGFIFVVNREGRIDFASENLTDYLGFQPESFTERPIFNFIHRGDHARQLDITLFCRLFAKIKDVAAKRPCYEF